MTTRPIDELSKIGIQIFKSQIESISSIDDINQVDNIRMVQIF